MQFTVLTLLLLAALCSCKEIVINLEDGQVKGQVVELNNKTIDIFKGIRFGKPPIGDLRFKRPEKVDKWTNIYDATTEKNSCWQIEVDFSLNKSEDCLFLNVWSPRNNSANKLPVMVWIYGGAFQIGSIWTPLYDGLLLSTLDVVVVSINYRVGPMGFIYDGTEEAPGNVGLYDQLLGLKWVQANINAFGGNPNDVTIFGESAGGMSVSFHVLSPLSKGLFKKAIIQSGTAYSEATYLPKSQSLNISKKHANEVGCKNESNWIMCLKQLDASAINNYTYDIINIMRARNFFPVIGEAFYPIKAFDAVKTGRFNSEISILAGVTQDEGSAFVYRWFDRFNSSSSKFNQNVKDYVFHEIDNWKHLESENVRKKVVDFYLSNETKVDMIKNTTGQIFGDYVLTCPTYFMPKDMVLWSGDNKVYLYKLTYKANTSLAGVHPNETWMGVTHASDLEFVFGFPLKLPQMYSKQEQQFSLLIMNLWTNFAKTGDPMKGPFNHVDLPGVNLKNIKWPSLKKVSFNQVKTQVMNLNPYFGTLLNEPYKRNCDGLWKPILKFNN